MIPPQFFPCESGWIIVLTRKAVKAKTHASLQCNSSQSPSGSAPLTPRAGRHSVWRPERSRHPSEDAPVCQNQNSAPQLDGFVDVVGDEDRSLLGFAHKVETVRA